MRLFLATADKDLRVGLQILIHRQPGFHVTGIAVNVKGLLSQLQAIKPDVLLLDWQLPGEPKDELISDIQALDLPLKIVGFAVRVEDENKARSLGIAAIVTKTQPPNQLIETLNRMSYHPKIDPQIRVKESEI